MVGVTAGRVKTVQIATTKVYSVNMMTYLYQRGQGGRNGRPAVSNNYANYCSKVRYYPNSTL